MNDFENKAIAASVLELSASKAATDRLDRALRQLIQHLRNGNGIGRPAALSLLEAARADIQRRIVETRLKAATGS